jgi:hypothetical protein
MEAVQAGFTAWASCTPNHPPGAPGYFGWAETVRTLRDRLTTKGWRRLNELNLPLVVNHERNLAIAVSTGDKTTGCKEGSPCTSSIKGPMTASVLRGNQLELFPDREPGVVVEMDRQRRLFSPAEMTNGSVKEDFKISKWTTWMLLVYRDAQEIRCELSLPVGMDEEGYVDEWKERIILTATPFDGEPSKLTEPKAPSSPEIIVEIKKRA